MQIKTQTPFVGTSVAVQSFDLFERKRPQLLLSNLQATKPSRHCTNPVEMQLNTRSLNEHLQASAACEASHVQCVSGLALSASRVLE
eukprot:3787518-Amphidinium_carterae.2